MEKAQSFIKKLVDTLCCCFSHQSNPEEQLRLINSQNNNYNNYPHEKKKGDPFFEQSIEDIIDQISSGDEDDPIDPAQEEKYEQILKVIED